MENFPTINDCIEEKDCQEFNGKKEKSEKEKSNMTEDRNGNKESNGKEESNEKEESNVKEESNEKKEIHGKVESHEKKESNGKVASDLNHITITKKELWLSLRAKYPKLNIRNDKRFRNAVSERLFTLLQIEKTTLMEDFVEREIHSFAQSLPYFWKRYKAKINDLCFNRHSKYFDGIIDPQNPIRNFVYVSTNKPASPAKMILRERDEISSGEKFQGYMKNVLNHLEISGQKDMAFVFSLLQQNPKKAEKIRKWLEADDSESDPDSNVECTAKSSKHSSYNVKEPVKVDPSYSQAWSFGSMPKQKTRKRKPTISKYKSKTSKREPISEPIFVTKRVKKGQGNMNNVFCI